MIESGLIQQDRRGVEALHVGSGFTGIAAMFRAGGEPGMVGHSQVKNAVDQGAAAVATGQTTNKLLAEMLSLLQGRGLAVRGVTLGGGR